MSTSHELHLEGYPSSVNALMKKNPRWAYQPEKKKWTAAWLPQLVGLEPAEAFMALGCITFPNRNARDQGNWWFMVEKSLGDALQLSGLIVDDRYSRFQVVERHMKYEKGVSCVDIELIACPAELS